MLKAVIFDMDGVIIDSEPMHARAAILALKKHNIDITTDYLQKFIGSTTYYMCQKMVDDFKLQVTPEELLEDNNEMKAFLLKKEGHTVIPYIIDLMKDLYNNQIMLTIASSSPAKAIEEVMNSLKIKDYFNGYVSGMMVTHPKPAPDIFLEAAKRLGVKPDECLVIEDSFHGVTAAKAAGMTCIGFINLNSGNQDLSKASMLVEGFDEIDYEFVNNVYRYDHLEPVNHLTTEHFIIRELSIDDIDDLYQICRQPDVEKFIDGLEATIEAERAKHKAYIQNVYHFYGYGLWGVFDKNSGRLVGRCGIELKQLNGEIIYEIGYLLSTEYQRHGYAKEFVSQIIDYCFTHFGITRIVAIIDKSNVRSIQLAKNLGMQCFGECTRNQRDCYIYDITYHQ